MAEARRLATAAGVANARFEVADAQVHRFGDGSFDVVLSSFGVMVFDDAAAGFANSGNAPPRRQAGIPVLAQSRGKSRLYHRVR